MSSKLMRDMWILHYGELYSDQVVEMVDPLKGVRISNLYIRNKEGSNILSESNITGLSGIEYDSVNNVYYMVRQHKRIIDSMNSDWRVTLNYRLKSLNSKWLRPAMSYDNTPLDVWNYVCRVDAGYHTGSIEDISGSSLKNTTSNIVNNPKLALFKVSNSK